jgi:hypothetical protein
MMGHALDAASCAAVLCAPKSIFVAIAFVCMRADAQTLEHEHLFGLGLGRPPLVHIMEDHCITPCLQRTVDAF